MSGFLNFIFYFILTILIIRLAFRIFFPIIIKRFIKRQAGKFQNMNMYGEDAHKGKEGEIHIETKDNNKKTNYTNDSEYIEYEEIK